MAAQRGIGTCSTERLCITASLPALWGASAVSLFYTVTQSLALVSCFIRKDGLTKKCLALGWYVLTRRYLVRFEVSIGG